MLKKIKNVVFGAITIYALGFAAYGIGVFVKDLGETFRDRLRSKREH